MQPNPFTDSTYVGFDYISPFIALTNERAKFSISGFRIEASKEPIGFKAHYLIDNNTDMMVLEPTEIYNETDQVFWRSSSQFSVSLLILFR